MGGDGDPADDFAVKSGPFRKDQWKLLVNPPGIQWSPSATIYLTRHMGSFLPSLPSSAELGSALGEPRTTRPRTTAPAIFSFRFRNNWEEFRSLGGTGQPAYVCGPDTIVAANPKRTAGTTTTLSTPGSAASEG